MPPLFLHLIRFSWQLLSAKTNQHRPTNKINITDTIKLSVYINTTCPSNIQTKTRTIFRATCFLVSFSLNVCENMRYSMQSTSDKPAHKPVKDQQHKRSWRLYHYSLSIKYPRYTNSLHTAQSAQFKLNLQGKHVFL